MSGSGWHTNKEDSVINICVMVEGVFQLDLSKLLNAHRYMFNRYMCMISNSNLENKQAMLDFCSTGMTLLNCDKASRWVGYIQREIIENGLTTIHAERNFSRLVYKPIYQELGWDNETVDVVTK